MSHLPPFDLGRAVTQTTFYDPDNPGAGNCTEAAIASLLQIPLDEVPKFYTGSSWAFWQNIDDFLEARGLELNIRKSIDPIDIPHLVSGMSSRGCSHMVIYQGDTLLWDPHPSREGVGEINHRFTIEPLSSLAIGPES